MNFGKVKVSKAAPLVGLLLALGLLEPAPSAAPRTPGDALVPAALAQATPPRQRVLSGTEPAAAAPSSCTNPPRELRFEMIGQDQAYPRPALRPVCLAVYRQ